MAAKKKEDAPLLKMHRPAGRAIEQQRLPAWQPILTAGTVLPMFFVVGSAFIPIGIAIMYYSAGVKELNIDYTNCTLSPGRRCADIIASNTASVCTCTVNFQVNETWTGNVYLYYRLTNYYQNHRRYAKSRDDNQLLGKVTKEPSEDCGTFSSAGSPKQPIVPCGAIANSLFNDSFSLTFMPPQGSRVPVRVKRQGIAWDSDKKMKFANPQIYDPAQPEKSFAGTAKPNNWPDPVYRLDPTNPRTNNGLNNEPLIVWMRTAAFPSFRKNYGVIEKNQTYFINGLPSGMYELSIRYNYPVVQFEGTKQFVLATTSLFGGKNPFLGIAYIAVGGLFLVTGVVLVFIHVKFGKTTREIIDVDPMTPY